MNPQPADHSEGRSPLRVDFVDLAFFAAVFGLLAYAAGSAVTQWITHPSAGAMSGLDSLMLIPFLR